MTGRRRGVIAAVAVLVASAVTAGALGRSTTGQTSNTSRAGAPRFEVDTSWQWPPALPSNWVVGVVSGVAVDRRDHVWVLHRFRQVPADQKDRASSPGIRRGPQVRAGLGRTGRGLRLAGHGARPVCRPPTLDGKYLDQVFVNPNGTVGPFTAGALAFSPDAAQQFLYVGDYDNGHIHIVNRKTLQVIGSIGSLGPSPGDFRGLHMLATDSKGNLWTAETQPRPTGSRVQRFVFKGVS